MQAKHDPNQLSIIYMPFRSVLSCEMASNLTQFINSEQYSVIEYQNIRFPLSPSYFTITPYTDALFSIPASGVTGSVATITLDTLIVVSGGTAGVHMFGESSLNIADMERSGILRNKNIIK